MNSSRNTRTCRWLILTVFLCSTGFVSNAQQPLDSTRSAQRYGAILAQLGKHEYTEAISDSKALIKDDPAFAVVYEKFVVASQRAGDLDQARVFFTEQLAPPVNNLRAHFGLGLISLERGDPATAIEEFKKCLLAFPEFLPAYNPLIDAARDANRLPEVEIFLKSLPQTTGPLYGVCYLRYRQARYDDSIKLSEQVLLLEPRLYQALQTKANSLYGLGRYSQAHQVAQTTLQTVTEPENVETRLRLLILKGMTAALIGSPNEGITDLISAYRGVVDTGNLALEENVHSQLGHVYQRQNECAPSLLHHRSALAVGQQLKSRFIGRHLGNIGVAYACLGDMNEAVTYYRKALDWHRDTGQVDQPNLVTVLTNLADDELGDNADALPLLERALIATRDITNKGMEVRVRLALGAVYEKNGDHLAALEQTRSAQQIAQEKQMTVQEGRCWNQLGRIYFSMLDLVQATGAHRQALAIGERAQAPQVIWDAFTGLGAIEQKQGHPGQAAQHYRHAIEAIEGMRSRIGISEDRASFFANKIAAYKKLVSVLLQSGNQRNTQATAEAFHYSERGRARAFLDLLAETKVDLAREGAAPDLLKQQQKLQQQISQLTDQLIKERSRDSNTQDKAKIAKLETDLGHADAELADWLRELRRRNPRYAALKYPEPITLSETQRMLDDDTVLLSYSLGESESFLFAVSRTDFQVKRLPAEKTLEANVQKLLAAITDKNNPAPAEYRRHAANLSQQLLQPVSRMLAGKKRLIIVADGALHRLPYEVLFQPDVPQRGDLRQWPFLIRNFAISYTPSASVLAQLQNESHATAPKSFIAFGDPKYELSADGVLASTLRATSASGRLNFQPLRYSHTEVDGIARLFAENDRELFFQDAASEENVKVPDRLSSYRLVHFSTHGYVNEARPRFSGLVLSLPSSQSVSRNSQSEDGLLAAYEIFNLKLKADLVVLSACETGLGKEVKGEGLMSLTRAFMYAGAPSVVVSLWNVNDESAADLMIRFYRHLQAGKTKSEALRQAQLETIRDNGFPFFWAPFVLIGKP